MKTVSKVIIAASVTLAVIFGAALGGQDSLSGQKSQNNSSYNSSITTPSTQKSIKTPQVTTKTVTSQVPIAHETVTQDDSALPQGTTKVLTEGSNGIREDTYSVTYTDDIETKRELKSSEIIKQPVTKIILKGTYVAPQPVCQNGSYINTAGQTVCRPSTNNTGGATAICRDGSYSYSQSRRGTCSHHGGVREWL